MFYFFRNSSKLCTLEQMIGAPELLFLLVIHFSSGLFRLESKKKWSSMKTLDTLSHRLFKGDGYASFLLEDKCIKINVRNKFRHRENDLFTH